MGKLIFLMLGALMLTCAVLFQNCAQPPLDAAATASTVEGDSRYRLPGASTADQLATGITCTAAVNATSIPAGGLITYTVSATGKLPADYRVYVFGTKNGVPDASEVTPTYSTSLIQSYTNPGYQGGSYTRSFQIRDSAGRTLCATNVVNLSLDGPQCTLSTPTPNLKMGSLMTLNISYGAGTTVPTDKSNVQFNGMNNGLVIPAIPYDGTVFTQYNKVMTATDVGNGYTRRITIRNLDGSIYCETNSLYLLVKP